MGLPKPGVSLVTCFDLCLCRRKLSSRENVAISGGTFLNFNSGLRQALNVSSNMQPTRYLMTIFRFLAWSLPLLLAGVQLWMSVTEYIAIALNGANADYPFGGEGPTPWYYQSASTYSGYMLALSIVLSILIASYLWFIYRRSRKGLLVVAAAIFFVTFLAAGSGMS